MTTTAWLWVGLVLLGLVVGGWLATRRKRGGDSAAPREASAASEPAPAALADVPVARPAPITAPPASIVPAAPPVVAAPSPVATPPTAVLPPPVAPPPPAPVPPRAAPVPPPAPPPPPEEPVPVTVIMAPRPPAPVIEHVIALEPASQADWNSALPLPLSVAQAASLAASLAAAGRDALYGIVFEAGATIAIGRAHPAFMRSLAAASAQVPPGPRRWLDSSAAAALAATALAGLANERYLEALGDEARELKTQLAALSPKLAALADNRLKTLVQDLSRFAREARDNYPSALGKAAFRERVVEAGERALEVWRALLERVDAMRQQLAQLARGQRFGELQVERALAQLRELGDLERCQEIAARSLAAAHVLRIVMGEPPVPGAVDPVASAAAALQAGVDQDLDLALSLSDGEKAARGDPYVGKGEFEANRAALRKLIGRPVAERAAPALERLEAARTAEALDPAGAPPRRLLVRLAGGACAIRWAVDAPRA
ncbi:MAG: hypothetical protein ABI699_09580 [Caldimonas sp.]